MKYIVEYSFIQKAYHLSTDEEWAGNICKTIEHELIENWKSDWKIIGEFNSYEEASFFIKKKRDDPRPI